VFIITPSLMRAGDLAKSPLASEWPDIADACDSLADRLREALAPFILRPQQPPAFAALDAVLKEAETRDGRASISPAQLAFETRRAIYQDTRLSAEARLQAAADGIAAQDPFFEKPYQWYADQFGFTRACVHSRARATQRALGGLRARRDKSDTARAKSAASASRPRSQRQPGSPAPAHTRHALTWFPGV
jgi:hypothetical protein